MTRVWPPAVFLDRDGVINREVDLLASPPQLVLLDGAAAGIRRLNRHGSRVVVVTNQSVVARGMTTPRGVVEIHRQLRRLLAQDGARLDAIYYCPYHENADLPRWRKASCLRKPSIGMLRKAAIRFRLDLGQCVMVGDQTSDLETGRRAGCRTILVGTGYAGLDGKYPADADAVCADLSAAARTITEDWITEDWQQSQPPSAAREAK